MASKKTKTFECEAMSHDLFSTKFCKDGKVDTLSRTDYKEPPVIAYTLILNDQGGDVINTSEEITSTLRAQDHGHPPVVCFEPGIARREGSDSRFVVNRCGTLRANMGDNQPAVCYAIEGNTVDRVSAKNGKGWCEDVSPTLNTQDRHAICYGISRSCLKGGNGSNGGMPVGENVMPAMTANGTGAVCHEK